MKGKNTSIFIGAILFTELVGIAGSLATTPAMPGISSSFGQMWYSGLKKSILTPPPWVFSPVWITLYLLMCIAAFLVWRNGLDRSDVVRALGIFGIQLTLNVLWPSFFFGLRNAGLALIDISFLWFAVIWTMIIFSKISKTAMYLLVPYIVWLSFAIYLNFTVWQLNP